MVCISVSAVTATGGSALTAGHFWKSAKSNQKRFAPPLGASPRLGMPSLRHCSVGRREGPSMAQRGYLGIHAEVPTAQYLRSASVVNGASRSRSRSRSKAEQERGIYPAFMWLGHHYRASSLPHGFAGVHSICIQHKKPVGASLLAMGPVHSASSSTVTSPSRASSLPQGKRVPHQEPGRLSGRLAVDVDLGAPLTTLAERRYCGVGIPAWMPG